MAKYRKKPVVIEAEQYVPGMEDGWGAVTDDRTVQFHAESKDTVEAWYEDFSYMAERIAPLIKSLDGWHVIEENDWIVTGVTGERSPVNDDVFHLTHEPVDSDGEERHKRKNPELRRFIDESGLV